MNRRTVVTFFRLPIASGVFEMRKGQGHLLAFVSNPIESYIREASRAANAYKWDGSAAEDIQQAKVGKCK